MLNSNNHQTEWKWPRLIQIMEIGNSAMKNTMSKTLYMSYNFIARTSGKTYHASVLVVDCSVNEGWLWMRICHNCLGCLCTGYWAAQRTFATTTGLRLVWL
ncbi:hypothetical protein FA947_03340 [Mycoplasmoides pneumoniae]|uniref:Uncharacterized protein n=1 Tax=Mycoplasmoides pneumoniae 309 TaxID=1112856 RepID=A0AB33HMX1_MYCPM|nr:hypothetical protein C897_03300 [Mycoplasmoides pneumoniae PI 1428]ALA30740.1 hypothetical protein B434_00930 [Mycoplasmoides pneumoniae 19294]ALA31845.1 hypothetical protein F536_03260 [Mycoplasmoides pneumoniae 39443]ALA32558.1 hypothetical protein F533_03295 [Mycoplasmoides pneumoniae 51494]ALA33259.1 hypothetical protein F530_03305 [Mycoplasmoides pneumoniae 54089]ALA33963.1 hypothetical protein F531_03300 [Mycoplasmoides pneumoniae 54524]ALA34680.1 hypothetical protein F537_03300 [Myc